jgi:hypothetical protein
VTVNNYGDLPEAPHPAVAPLTSRQKFQLFAEETFDPGVVLIAAGLAGLQQAGNLAPDYGQGGAAYAQRLGAVNASIAGDSLFTLAVMPSLFHQDPRYFKKQWGSAWGRIYYAISRVAVTQTDRGNSAFNFDTAMSIALLINCVRFQKKMRLLFLEVPKAGATEYQNLMRQNPKLTRSDATEYRSLPVQQGWSCRGRQQLVRLLLSSCTVFLRASRPTIQTLAKWPAISGSSVEVL